MTKEAETNRVNRRDFCRQVFVAGAVSSGISETAHLLDAQIPPPQALRNLRTTSGRAVLQLEDLTYRGRFRPPFYTASHWRYRNLTSWVVEADGQPTIGPGEFRLLGLMDRLDGVGGLHIMEFVPPATLGRYPDKPAAPVMRSWLLRDAVGTENLKDASQITGIHYDAASRKLYSAWQSGSMSYNNAQNTPCVGRSSWNGTAWEPEGRWSMGAHIGSKIAFDFTNIPDWFVQQHNLGNRRIGVGMGSYRSTVATGPASIGPALVAITPPTTPPNADVNQATALMLHHHTSSGANDAIRDDDYAEVRSEVARLPVDGAGQWTWLDWCHTGGLWIDTPTKSGFLIIAGMVSSGGSGNGGVSQVAAVPTPTRTSLRLTAPIIGLEVGDFIGIKSTFANQNAHGTVTSITDGGLSIGFSGWPQNPPYAGSTEEKPHVPLVGGWVVKGAWYSMAYLHASRSKHMAFIYSPAQLGEVVAGRRAPHALRPSAMQDWKLPGWTYPARRYSSGDVDFRGVNGLAFDPETRRLYMAPGDPADGFRSRVIEVYEVSV